MNKTISIRVNETILEKFKKLASIENRSLSNFIETAIIKYMKESELLDKYEDQNFLNNSDLMKRLKKGSLDAKKRKGRFI